MTDKPMTVGELINVNNQLYEVLKHLYDQLDHPMNSKLKDKEYILHNIHYSGALQKKIRAALKSYRKIV